MKLLTQYESDAEASRASSRLELKGIATYVSSRHALGLPAWTTGPAMIGLWVVLDDQYEDAVELLFNPDHTVRHPLSIAEIETVRKGIHDTGMSAAMNALAWMCGGLLLFVTVVYLVTGLE